jgi:hypothetical protein
MLSQGVAQLGLLFIVQNWVDNKQLIKFFRNCFTTLLGKESYPLAKLTNKSIVPLRIAGDALLLLVDELAR